MRISQKEKEVLTLVGLDFLIIVFLGEGGYFISSTLFSYKTKILVDFKFVLVYVECSYEIRERSFAYSKIILKILHSNYIFAVIYP